MEQSKLDRINALYKKSKTDVGLTSDEKTEQDQLRKEYIALVRKNLRGTLDNTTIKFPDGTTKKVEKKRR